MRISTMSEHGLSARQLDTIAGILARHCPHLERAALFGSRAMGNYQAHSDIDLVLYGDIEAATVDRLWTVFHESALPYKVDVQAFHLVKYPPLKRHIETEAKTLFTQSEIQRRANHGESPA